MHFVDQPVGLLDQRGGQGYPRAALDLQQDLLPWKAGEAFGDLRRFDGVSAGGQKLRLDLGRDHFRIDQDAVAVEDHKLDIVHVAVRLDGTGGCRGNSGKVDDGSPAGTADARARRLSDGPSGTSGPPHGNQTVATVSPFLYRVR